MKVANGTAIEANIEKAVAHHIDTQALSRGRMVRAEDITSWMVAEQEAAEVDFLRMGIKSNIRAFDNNFDQFE